MTRCLWLISFTFVYLCDTTTLYTDSNEQLFYAERGGLELSQWCSVEKYRSGMTSRGHELWGHKGAGMGGLETGITLTINS